MQLFVSRFVYKVRSIDFHAMPCHAVVFRFSSSVFGLFAGAWILTEIQRIFCRFLVEFLKCKHFIIQWNLFYALLPPPSTAATVTISSCLEMNAQCEFQIATCTLNNTSVYFNTSSLFQLQRCIWIVLFQISFSAHRQPDFQFIYWLSPSSSDYRWK